jgi:hypothetical protein
VRGAARGRPGSEEDVACTGDHGLDGRLGGGGGEDGDDGDDSTASTRAAVRRSAKTMEAAREAVMARTRAAAAAPVRDVRPGEAGGT